MGSKRLVHWTSETWYWSEIAGPPHPYVSVTTAMSTINILHHKYIDELAALCINNVELELKKDECLEFKIS
jgi:hypothetical protein